MRRPVALVLFFIACGFVVIWLSERRPRVERSDRTASAGLRRPESPAEDWDLVLLADARQEPNEDRAACRWGEWSEFESSGVEVERFLSGTSRHSRRAAHGAARVLLVRLREEPWCGDAASALGSLQCTCDPVVDALMGQLFTKHAESEFKACDSIVQALADLGRTSPRVVARLVHGLRGRYPGVCADALGEIGPSAGTAAARSLVAALDNADIATTRAICWALGLLRDPVAVEPLRELLDVPARRTYALVGLGLLGPAARSAVPAVCQIALDDKAECRSRARGTLARIDPEGERAVPLLIEGLRALRTRHMAARSLAVFGRHAAAAAPLLLAALEDASGSERRDVIFAIGEIGPAAAGAAEALLAEADNRADVSEAAYCALGKLGSRSRAVEATLIAAAYRNPPSLWAVESLGLLRCQTPACIRCLEQGLASEDEWLRFRSAQALGRSTGDPRRVAPVLARLLTHSGDPQLVHDVVLALGELELSEPYVIRALQKVEESGPTLAAIDAARAVRARLATRTRYVPVDAPRGAVELWAR